jgi:hypothetical protein
MEHQSFMALVADLSVHLQSFVILQEVLKLLLLKGTDFFIFNLGSQIN